MTEAHELILGKRLDARYTLLDKLGAGGQGEVWRAHDATRGVDIALKVLNPTNRAEEAWIALEREHAIANLLDHPSILKVFVPERDGDKMVLPMELASGGDLRRLRGAGFLEIIPALLEVAQALEHAHERGVVHRDLKPSNVIFDARGRARLADFGVAETAQTTGGPAGAESPAGATRETNRHGYSPFTASPAQLRGESPTPADDVYGLGALAYELLSGYPPYYPHFDKKRAMEERVPTLVPTRQIPPLLGTLVMHMLAKDPKRRPRSMREVIDELDAALNDTLTYDFENVSPATPTASAVIVAEAERSASARSRTGMSPDSDQSWTPDGRDRRASPDRRGRRKEDWAPQEPREPTGASDLSPAAAGSGSGSMGSVPAARGTDGSPGETSAGGEARSIRRSDGDALARIDAALERSAADAAARARPSPSASMTQSPAPGTSAMTPGASAAAPSAPGLTSGASAATPSAPAMTSGASATSEATGRHTSPLTHSTSADNTGRTRFSHYGAATADAASQPRSTYFASATSVPPPNRPKPPPAAPSATVDAARTSQLPPMTPAEAAAIVAAARAAAMRDKASNYDGSQTQVLPALGSVDLNQTVALPPLGSVDTSPTVALPPLSGVDTSQTVALRPLSGVDTSQTVALRPLSGVDTSQTVALRPLSPGDTSETVALPPLGWVDTSQTVALPPLGWVDTSKTVALPPLPADYVPPPEAKPTALDRPAYASAARAASAAVKSVPFEYAAPPVASRATTRPSHQVDPSPTSSRPASARSEAVSQRPGQRPAQMPATSAANKPSRAGDAPSRAPRSSRSPDVLSESATNELLAPSFLRTSQDRPPPPAAPSRSMWPIEGKVSSPAPHSTATAAQPASPPPDAIPQQPSMAAAQQQPVTVQSNTVGHQSTFEQAPAANQVFGPAISANQAFRHDTVTVGTYADPTSILTRDTIRAAPMDVNWGEATLEGLPKVARLQPIRPRRWPWILFGLVAGAAAAIYFWLPRFDTQTLPPEVAAVVEPLKAAVTSTTNSPVDVAQGATSSGNSVDTSTPGAAAMSPGVVPAAALASGTAASPRKSVASTSAGAAKSAEAADASSTQATTGSTQAAPGDEQNLREMRQVFDNRLASLQARGAGAWGGHEYSMAKTRAAESVGAYDAGNPRVAQERLSAAMKLLDTVESKAPQALSTQIAAGEQALGAGQQEVAGQAFDLARRINPSDRRVTDGQRRTQNLPAVLPLLADAQNAEAARDFARAAQDYSQALSLDPGNATAKAGQGRANAAFGDDSYAKAVGSGFAALGAGRLDEAHEAFVKARALNPKGAEASEGLRRVGYALTARGFASMRQRAVGLEAQERWDEAERTYEDVLAADSSLAFAQEGKARTTSRADLSLRLQQLLDRPDRLASPGVKEDASALLETARAQSPQGPVIRSQIARLEGLLPSFDRPVHLSLVSDNSTQVTISSIGEFGTFSHRDVQLRPGKYIVVGTRNGFRDVRREITLAPGQDAQTVRVTCSEPI